MRQWLTRVSATAPDDVLPQGERLAQCIEVVGFLHRARLEDEADAFSRDVSDAVARFVRRLHRSAADRAEANHLFPLTKRGIAKWLAEHPDPALAEASNAFLHLAREDVSPK